MSSPRRRTVKIVYNGVDAQSEISKYLEKFTYEDSTDKSDTISLSVADRDLKWRGMDTRKGGHNSSVNHI